MWGVLILEILDDNVFDSSSSWYGVGVLSSRCLDDENSWYLDHRLLDI